MRSELTRGRERRENALAARKEEELIADGGVDRQKRLREDRFDAVGRILLQLDALDFENTNEAAEDEGETVMRHRIKGREGDVVPYLRMWVRGDNKDERDKKREREREGEGETHTHRGEW